MSVPGCRCRLYGGVVLCQAGRYCELLYLTLMLLSTDRLLGGCQGAVKIPLSFAARLSISTLIFWSVIRA